MNIKALVDRGLEAREQIERLQKELKEIEGKLKEAGLKSEQEDLKDADREGKRWLAHGTRFAIPIIFTADKIVGQFKANSVGKVKAIFALPSPTRTGQKEGQ